MGKRTQILKESLRKEWNTSVVDYFEMYVLVDFFKSWIVLLGISDTGINTVTF